MVANLASTGVAANLIPAVGDEGKRNIHQGNKSGPVFKATNAVSNRTTSPHSHKAHWRNPPTSAQPYKTFHNPNHKTTFKTSGQKSTFTASSSRDVPCSTTESPSLITSNPFGCLQPSVKKYEDATSTPIQKEYCGIQEMRIDRSKVEVYTAGEYPNQQSCVDIQKERPPIISNTESIISTSSLPHSVEQPTPPPHSIQPLVDGDSRSASPQDHLQPDVHSNRSRDRSYSPNRIRVVDRGSPSHDRAEHGELRFPNSQPQDRLNKGHGERSHSGAGNKVFKRNLREIISNHKPSIVVLMETKVQLSSMGLFFNKLGFTASTHVDPVIYASPNPRSRDALWNNLESMADNISEPWLVAGDFNDFTNLNEKRRFSTNQDQVRTRKFQARLNRCRLMDLGCSGPRLTWSNGRQGMANTLERLDRAVCTTEWRLQFQEGAVRNLPRTYSDHAPVIIYTEGMQHSDPILRPFRMEAAWFVNPDFKNLVKDSWDETNNSILEVITSITAKASHWNKNNRLTGWKANMLSITERATLINSVTSALLAYMMQTMDLPANVCKDMDRLNKNILWGDVGTSKKIHLVNWATIWKNRNLQIFENVDLPWQQSLYLILRYATDIKDAFNLSIVNILDNELIS
ncbi:hypothetical protein ACSBR2_028888 [Camellia fascicularis]